MGISDWSSGRVLFRSKNPFCAQKSAPRTGFRCEDRGFVPSRTRQEHAHHVRDQIGGECDGFSGKRTSGDERRGDDGTGEERRSGAARIEGRIEGRSGSRYGARREAPRRQRGQGGGKRGGEGKSGSGR